MRALILAAGEGKRLYPLTKEKPKALVKVAGVPLVERVLYALKKVGIDEASIVVGCKGELIEKRIGESFSGMKIGYIKNHDWEKGNLYSLIAAKDKFRENFLLLMSDHLFDDRVISSLVAQELDSSIKLVIERRKGSEDDTGVLERNGRIEKIGKGLKESNCIDTGLFLCSPKFFSYAERAKRENKGEVADGVALAAEAEDAEIFDMAKIDAYVSGMRREVPPYWMDVDSKEEIKEAKRLLVENASKGASDFLAYYVHKPVENKIVYYLSETGITPNQVTIMVNVLAYFVTALFFTGHLLLASILIFLVGILDGLDGKLSRVKNQTTKLGSMEHSFDFLYECSWFIALALNLQIEGESLALTSRLSISPLVFSVFIILFVAFYRNCYDQFRKTAGKSLDDWGRFERVFRRIAGRRNLYNLPILTFVLLGMPIYSLVFVFFHSMFTMIVYGWRVCKHLREEDRKAAR